MGEKKRMQEVAMSSETPIGEESSKADWGEETTEAGRPPGGNISKSGGMVEGPRNTNW